MPAPRRRRAVLLAGIPCGAAAIALSLLALRFGGAQDPCGHAASAVVVTARGRALWLCEGGRARERFRVSLGTEGVGKQAQGDRRTPLGTYPLGAPRPSARWGAFIPIGYPTAAQAQQGFTGSAVGIHGPERRLRWAGRANAWLDWTAGCVAVADDAALARVAEVARRGGATITIR